jgi:hypothetical protein
MDVLSLRKSTGIVTGEVRVNGHLQDPSSFSRLSGYVAQVRRPGTDGVDGNDCKLRVHSGTGRVHAFISHIAMLTICHDYSLL